MDIQTFLQQVTAMQAFTPEVHDYAASVGRQADDAGRASLMDRLVSLHAKADSLEGQRVANCQTATRDLDELIRNGLPLVRHAAEADASCDDHETLSSIERQMNT